MARTATARCAIGSRGFGIKATSRTRRCSRKSAKEGCIQVERFCRRWFGPIDAAAKVAVTVCPGRSPKDKFDGCGHRFAAGRATGTLAVVDPAGTPSMPTSLAKRNRQPGTVFIRSGRCRRCHCRAPTRSCRPPSQRSSPMALATAAGRNKPFAGQRGSVSARLNSGPARRCCFREPKLIPSRCLLHASSFQPHRVVGP